MRESSHNGAGGILEPVWRLADHTLAAAQNRIELFQVEAQEEKARLLEIILLASVFTVLLTLGLAAATFAIVLIVWRDGAMIALACLIIAYIAGAGAAGHLLHARLKAAPPFAAS